MHNEELHDLYASPNINGSPNKEEWDGQNMWFVA